MAALVYLVLGVIGAISLGGSGLGEGWSSGWRGWLTIPILAGTCLGFVALLVFGALLYFLAKIDNNLAEAQQRMAEAAAKSAAVAAPVAVAAGVAAAAPGRARRRCSSCRKLQHPWPQQPSQLASWQPNITRRRSRWPRPWPMFPAVLVEAEAPVIAAAAIAGAVAAEHHEEAVEVAAPEADVAAPAVEAEVPVIAAAVIAGAVADAQHDAEVELAATEVEGAAPAVEVEAPAAPPQPLAVVAAAELPEETAEVEVAAPVVETPTVLVADPRPTPTSRTRGASRGRSSLCGRRRRHRGPDARANRRLASAARRAGCGHGAGGACPAARHG